MRRRSPPRERARGRALALGCAAWFAVTGAQADVSGSLDALARISPDGRHGAGVTADVLWGRGVLRGGLSLGVAALRRGGGETNAVLTPVGLAGALRFLEGEHGAAFVGLRAGAGLGAQQGGFFVGPFAAGLAGYALKFGEAASFRLGVEAGALRGGARDEAWFGPFLGLGF